MFPGVPGLAGTRMSPFWILLQLRLIEMVVTTGAVRRAKVQSIFIISTNQHPVFYRPDALPVAQSELWRKKRGRQKFIIRKEIHTHKLHGNS